MTNTRIIFPATEPFKTIQFSNQDNVPYVMQLWTDTSNPDSTPDDADAPFIVAPVIFRIEPHSGQSARLHYIGKALPPDRESLFYLNFTQIPPGNIGGETNKLLLILKSRVKIFYRPPGIKGSPADIDHHLTFQLTWEKGNAILQIKNSASYYASFAHMVIKGPDNSWPVEIDMIAPQSRQSLSLKHLPQQSSAPLEIEYTLINDSGRKIKHQITL
ncbi:fimbrial biogenesis chaperone [[Erwinia] mediterraneensis]|uniref:fimbrial biogenesis chaperone n=1 Tax=[Erwinia] mediterraneensis TaxID=2161819 RepID=UPI0013EF2447|nr:molecular chaperone [[Erwinia] mediterraneensis]